jgi:hypothetical protein
MKISNVSFVAAFACSIAFWSCKSNSSNPSTDSGTFDTRGSDYMPLQSGQVVSAHFQGVYLGYDINGSLVRMDSMIQDHTTFIMGATSIFGLPGFSIGAYNDRGVNTNGGRPSGYGAISNDNVYGCDKEGVQKTLVLPAVLSDGLAWNPDPDGDPAYKATLVGHMASFTTRNGNTYPNVIQVEATIVDSLYTGNGASADIRVNNIAATFYFAKDVGPIEVNIHQSEQHNYSLEAGVLHGYGRIVLNGVVSRNKQ